MTDINNLRAVVVVLGLVSFIAIAVWAWSRRRQEAFDEAAQLPFQGDDSNEPSGAGR